MLLGATIGFQPIEVSAQDHGSLASDHSQNFPELRNGHTQIMTEVSSVSAGLNADLMAFQQHLLD